MRQVVYGGAVSLDNYLARRNHDVDWLLWSDEVAAFMAEFWPRFDTVLMGRRTYDFAARAGQAGGYPGVECRRFRTGCVLLTYRVKHRT